MRRHRRSAWSLLVALSLIAATCGGDSAVTPGDTGPDVEASDCIVRLHGRAGNGAPDELVDGIAELRPTGNRENLGGFAWFYETPDEEREVIDTIAGAVAASACRNVVLTGFSNGAAAAAKVLCSGETFGDRLRGVLIDDPVTDAATTDCTPAPGVDIAIYWTGGLADTARTGIGCDEIGYICDGDTIIGIDTMATNIGVLVLASPFTEHVEYVDAPEPRAWLGS